MTHAASETSRLRFDSLELPPDAEALRAEVRSFLRDHEMLLGRRNSDFTGGFSPEFSRALGARGWIGMTWPKALGGQARSFFERYVVTEELLAAGAPVAAHWIADRQTGPLLLRYGTTAQQQYYLPKIAAGTHYCSIGMSEPDAGSDLAAVSTRAVAVDGGFRVNGTKLWSTGAHRNDYLVALVRTGDAGPSRHEGLSQLIVHLKEDAVSVRPIRNLAGDEDFNEIVFTDTFLPRDRLIGAPGNGWEQVTSELGYERSGPERFLSAFRVLVEFARLVAATGNDSQRQLLGQLTAQLMTLRRMSISVAGMLEAGVDAGLEAALVKEQGNAFEQRLPDLVRLAVGSTVAGDLREALLDTQLLRPSFSLRGGTREILRGMIARGLGVR